MARILCLKSPQTLWPVYDMLSLQVENFESMIALPLGVNFSNGHDGIAAKIADQTLAAQNRVRAAQGKPPLGNAFRRARLRAHVNALMAKLQRDKITHVLVWNGLKERRLLMAQAARAVGAQTIYGEVAPLPGKICFDAKGVNQNNSLPRDAQFYLNWMENNNHAPQAWRALGDEMNERVARDGAPQDALFDETEPFIFVPLQVPDDSQITEFSDWTRSAKNFVNIVARMANHLPTGWHIKIKEHPSARIRLTDTIKPLLSKRLRLANSNSTIDMMRHCQMVLSVNSSVALQAFYFDKPVLLCGQSYFGFAPLTAVAKDETALANFIANPSQVTFSKDARAAFMTYLSEEYFFDGNNALKTPRLAQHEVPRFAQRFGLTLKERSDYVAAK